MACTVLSESSSNLSSGACYDGFSNESIKQLATAAVSIAAAGIGLSLLGAGLAAAPVTGVGTALGSSLVTAGTTKLLFKD